jgi:hypothetical protein
MTAARQYLSAAIGYDPRYAKAITMLALTHYFDVRFSYTTAIEEAMRSNCDGLFRFTGPNL